MDNYSFQVESKADKEKYFSSNEGINRRIAKAAEEEDQFNSLKRTKTLTQGSNAALMTIKLMEADVVASKPYTDLYDQKNRLQTEYDVKEEELK